MIRPNRRRHSIRDLAFGDNLCKCFMCMGLDYEGYQSKPLCDVQDAVMDWGASSRAYEQLGDVLVRASY